MEKLDFTLGEKIYKELYDDITQQRLVSGQKLTLPMLKKRFNVSHTPIREALSRLVSDGLVTYSTNKGMKVVEFSEEEIKEIFQFMAELETVAVRLCSMSYAPAPMLDDLRRIVEAEKAAMEENDFEKWNDAANKIHSVFFYYANNRYLDEAATKMSALMDAMAHMYSNEETSADIYDRHLKIYEAAKNKDYEAICDLVRGHLQFSMVYVIEEIRKKK